MGAYSTVLGSLGTRETPRRGLVEVLWPDPTLPIRQLKPKRATQQGLAVPKAARDVEQDSAPQDATPPRDTTVLALDALISQDTSLAQVKPREEAGFEVLSSLYAVRESVRVRQFLSAHTGLKKLLFAAYPKIKGTWGPDTRTELEVFSDPEDDSVSLVVYISSDRADAFQLLDRFDEDWWLPQAPSSEGLLTFALQ